MTPLTLRKCFAAPGFTWFIALTALLTGKLQAQEAESVKHWAYLPVEAVKPPEVSEVAWESNPIDRFIRANLEKQGLKPNPAADRLTLLRRAYYDLTGLPPTQEQTNAFLQDDSPHAWERLIDQLLVSPHYGEKWGRHWLDLVRWAESNGYERDGDKRNMWKYRDYIIRAINNDMPYDEFIIDQIAGDIRPEPTSESIIATGFLHLGLYDDEPADEELFYFDYYDDIINTVSRSMLATSMSCARCHDHKIDPITQKEYYEFLAYFRNLEIPYRARGEDISTVSIFDPEKEGELNQRLETATRNITKTRLQMWEAASQLLSSNEESSQDLDTLPSELRFRFAMEDWSSTYGDLDHTDYLLDGELPDGTVTLPQDLTQITQAKVMPSAFVVDGKFHQPEPGRTSFQVTINGGAWMYLGEELVFSKVGLNTITEDFSIDLPAGTHDLRIIASRHVGLNLEINLLRDGQDPLPWVRTESWRGIKGDVKPLLKEDVAENSSLASAFESFSEQESSSLKTIEPLEEILRSSLVTAAKNSDEEKSTHILFRGNPHAPGEEVQPGLPSVMVNYLPEPDKGMADRRLQIARWIASEENPLTARVAVNRIWQHHFGRGLVRSSDEFGGLGDEPTHPELLDWLADAFVRNGWHMKPLHRLIMTSRAYMMSSAPNEVALKEDPLNENFWRFNMRRLTAEEIRDSVLIVANHFNPLIGGPSVFPTLPQEVLDTASRPAERWELEAGPEHQNRRSLYTFTRRSLLDPMMSTFDAADTDTSCPVRFNTTVPAQALTMMNSEFVADHAERLAGILLHDSGKDKTSLVKEGFESVLGRLPNAEELKISLDLMSSMEQDFGHDYETAVNRFALMMLNLNEFVFLD